MTLGEDPNKDDDEDDTDEEEETIPLMTTQRGPWKQEQIPSQRKIALRLSNSTK